MPEINGSRKAQPMEMETLNPGHYQPPRPHPIDQLLTLTKLYMESYPKITTVIVFSIIGLLMLAVTPSFQSAVHRNRLTHDYSAITQHYDFKASQMDHWCLWGGDQDCKCLDFTEPESCADKPGWVGRHERNKLQGQFDVVFVGDEMVEKMAGTIMGTPTLESKQVAKLFNQTFSKADGGIFDGAALGIAGDATANVIWRLQHGEMSPQLSSNIYWLWVGMNDLTDGYCSEEAVVLGILRTAEELALLDPGSDIVVQGILPLSKHEGHLTDTGKHSIFQGRNPKAHTVKQAKNRYLFWPSIQAINEELERFCTKHPRMVYFDAGKLFLGSSGNSVYKGKEEHIIHELMPDYVHPSLNGYKVLLKAIREEVERILYDGNEENDVEEKGSRLLR